MTGGANRLDALRQEAREFVAGAVATGAHQLHGAIGVTLHRLTRRLWAWREADGSQRRWEETVGAEVLLGDGDEGLWSLVAGAEGAATAVPV